MGVYGLTMAGHAPVKEGPDDHEAFMPLSWAVTVGGDEGRTVSPLTSPSEGTEANRLEMMAVDS